MDATTVIGIIASTFTSISLLPQLFKIFREKSAKGTSWLMLGSLFIGLSFWIWYGVKKEDLIIIISNGFALLVNVTVVLLSLYYTKQKNSDPA